MNPRLEAYSCDWGALLQRGYRIVKTRLKVRRIDRVAEIDDCVGRAALSIVSRLVKGPFENRNGIMGYASTAFINRTKNRNRDSFIERRRINFPSDRSGESNHDGDIMLLIPDEHPSPEAMVIHEEAMEDLRRVVQGFSVEEQELIALKYGEEDLTNGQIAQRLGTTEGVIKSRVYRLTRNLRKRLDPRDF